MDQDRLMDLKDCTKIKQTGQNNGTSPDDQKKANTITIVVNSENYQVEIEIY